MNMVTANAKKALDKIQKDMELAGVKKVKTVLDHADFVDANVVIIGAGKDRDNELSPVGTTAKRIMRNSNKCTC
jgi:hypothetical protein